MILQIFYRNEIKNLFIPNITTKTWGDLQEEILKYYDLSIEEISCISLRKSTQNIDYILGYNNLSFQNRIVHFPDFTNFPFGYVFIVTISNDIYNVNKRRLFRNYVDYLRAKYFYNSQSNNFQTYYYTLNSQNIFTNLFESFADESQDRLTQEEIDTLPKGPFSIFRENSQGPQMCSISLREFQDDTQIIKLPCNHLFCEEEIKRWLLLNNRCPLCRAKVINRE